MGEEDCFDDEVYDKENKACIYEDDFLEDDFFSEDELDSYLDNSNFNHKDFEFDDY
jgi:hypothetical protein